ncbi:phage holin family protein [Alkalicoccus daliensis]|uniref:Putative membrane protein n=1 Tax=Alkalicoccus daliensis TaxID=745820 RepID=A0A1H0JRM1_9BACI|nr:phage holin family protein [Alkalicoccus daliensis]SDO46183.1 putative membrane protein [Alkalicoccus daliensis]
MSWLIQLIVNAGVLLLIANVFGNIELTGFGAALLASFILAVVNVIVKPILVVLTLPVTILTLGLFLFVINAITLMLTAWMMGDSFVIDGFGAALLASIIFAILNAIISNFIVDPLTKK